MKREEEQVKRQEDQEESLLTRLQAERDALLVLGLGVLSSQQKKRLNAVLDEREAIMDRRERRRVVAKRKRKKKRLLEKNVTSSTLSSLSSAGAWVLPASTGLSDRWEMTFFYGPLYLAVTCLVLACQKSTIRGFFGSRLLDLFPYSALYLVRQWIHIFASIWRPGFGSCDRFSSCSLLSLFLVLCLVRQWIHVFRHSTENFLFFCVNWWITDPEVDSRLSLRT